MATEQAEGWEDLPQKLNELKVEDTADSIEPAVEEAGAGDSPKAQNEGVDVTDAVPATVHGNGSNPSGPQVVPQTLPDQALLSSLLDQNKERALVLRMEQEVLNFLDDARDILEFPVDYSNYQRMLAHKVAQYYGLHTSTADYEGHTCRVVAHRCAAADKSKPRLASLDVSQGSPLALAAAKGAAAWQEAPKLLRRPNNRHERPMGPGYDQGSLSSSRTPKDREEEYDRAKARIFADSEGGMSGGGGRGSGGRGPIIAGRGRRGGRGDRAAELQHDPDYIRGMPRYGMVGMYDGNPGMGPVMMMPGAGPAMYAMPQQPEMAWAGGMAMYAMPGRQPPPPPPGAAGSKGGSAANGMWAAGGSSGAPSTMSSTSTPGATPTSGVPPPPPPPHPGVARPYAMQPGAAMHMGMGGYPVNEGGHMVMYPGQPMQVMPGGHMYTYAMPAGGGYGGYVPEGAVSMSHGTPVAMGAYPSSVAAHHGGYTHAGSPHVSMQHMHQQGYGAMAYATPAGPHMASPHAMAARPAGPGMTMAYAPMAMGGQPGYAHAVHYPMATMQAAPAHPAAYGGMMMQGGGRMGGRGGGRGGYKHVGGSHPPPPPQASLPGSTVSTVAPGAAAAAAAGRKSIEGATAPAAAPPAPPKQESST